MQIVGEYSEIRLKTSQAMLPVSPPVVGDEAQYDQIHREQTLSSEETDGVVMPDVHPLG